MYLNELMDTCFCVVQYCNQPRGIQDKSSKHKTDVRNCVSDDHENMITWDEQMDLGPFYTLDTMLHVRIFQYKIARKDLLIGEVDIPLVKIISKLCVSPDEKTTVAGSDIAEADEINLKKLSSDDVSVVGRELVDWYIAENKDYLLENTGGELQIGVEFTGVSGSKYSKK